MKIRAEKGDIEKVQCDLLIVGMFDSESNRFTTKLDERLNSELAAAMKRKEFTGEAGQLKMIASLGKLPAQKVLVVGLGKKADYKIENLRRAAASAIRVAQSANARKTITALHHLECEKADEAERITALLEGSLLGSYQFNQFKTDDKEKEKRVDDLIVLTDQPPAAEKAIKKAEIICTAALHVRDMVNLPSNIVTPSWLADEAAKLKKLGVKVTVYGKEELKKMNFNALLAVSQGSVLEPKFVVMEHGSGKEPVAFVGKGITFDSGGLDIKPAKGMEDMKMDKAGAATVIGLMEAVAQLKMPQHIICAFPTCENMPSGTAYRPGDIIKGYNKKTIEMMNTDAEGRMVLSDALSYVEKEFAPSAIIDLATLTGACVVALGYWATGLFTTDDKLFETLKAAGKETGERVWRLPLWDEYKDNLKTDVADIRSVGRSYDAGAIEGATFLKNFIEKTPWVHLDIAGTAWMPESKFYFSRGATGNGVRLLVKWLEKR
ncbi:MAG TPA: leucyl aminopeptidase [Candidatus Nanoarchaeia archaeon]|nr:leucyl aminopeptidase [Candidatus Nanoarchaeia archaeon]